MSDLFLFIKTDQTVPSSQNTVGKKTTEKKKETVSLLSIQVFLECTVFDKFLSWFFFSFFIKCFLSVLIFCGVVHTVFLLVLFTLTVLLLFLPYK